MALFQFQKTDFPASIEESSPVLYHISSGEAFPHVIPEPPNQWTLAPLWSSNLLPFAATLQVIVGCY